MVPGYREVRELGTGGGGRVVLATYTETGAYVAIKYLNSALKDDHRFVARLRRDARVLVDLDHPNVVRLYEYYEDVLYAAVVMELVDGVALRRILAHGGATGPEAALAVFKDVLLGLAKAHSRGIVHRDCRPENVLVQADGNAKLSDFGLAVPAGSAGEPAGGPAYLAPERWSGHPASPAADLYAATRVFSECLTGRAPYRADLAGAPAPAEAVPDPVRRLVARGTAENPADRPPTARTFAAELEVAALAAYGPEWEQRGRRRLAERATLLALTFPLARAAPQEGIPAARARGCRMDRLRRGGRSPGARLVSAAAVAAVAVTTALVAADRPSGPLASDTVFTPPPGSHSAGGAGSPEGAADPRSGSPAPSGTSKRSRNVAADRPAPPETSAPGRPATTPRESRSAVPVKPPPPDPTGGTPPPTAPPSSPAPRHEVSGLAVAGIDGGGATVALRASTTAEVVLTARFAEGRTPDLLEETAVRTVALSGSDTYVQQVPHAFTAPPCGQTLFRRVTAATSPQAPDGAHSLVVEVRGDPCPSPSQSGGPTGDPGNGPGGEPEGDPENDPGDGAGDGPQEPAGDPSQDPAGRDESGEYHTL
ncbi:protein kinase [Planomonospora sp. ID67723]|uniref:serine/threonine-protein kinase n=1 Tax=Planomonospora sp. ID67723 TaxID=2738134 RepID=UPI0018C43FE0|nr:serine/threonine-protein kinase [Planomonospora sp. ID67723]MBG0828692.1 protein kinase [Planomonospora sp. ID67723]